MFIKTELIIDWKVMINSNSSRSEKECMYFGADEN